jgi:hypothetical protein
MTWVMMGVIVARRRDGGVGMLPRVSDEHLVNEDGRLDAKDARHVET